ncbi:MULTISPECIES: AMP-dependent synthetase/ligase [Streptomyces]|uniref:Acyl-CoA synthetase n=1 Tax=Streptomyces albus (strain ATCC 21838 / DSM 41398 / FERM P-419 / JCM 4703 / NBRC 107858) TaxID=1081613 RepID=A0A0B5EUJ6_STRA4|nr:AMP-dependent synthetase/ligase [Streptomyces sp. SCSIO ZS0520]AJE85434.1 long-chain fatty acid ligase [Streptomyces albus]AOU79738.1 long-chain fatty acid ligase [Streptomyces albus]AYN35462.1 long-chain fatty acid--CoA ligase [Streptomyces albus]
MGVRKDLKTAQKRPDLATRVKLRLTRDENGVVREAHAEDLVPPAPGAGVPDIPYVNAAEAPDAVVIRRKEGGAWRPVTSAQFAREVTATAKGLIAAGLEPGGRVAVMSRTRYEWCVLDFAIWAAGGQSVPIYATSSPGQIEWIVRDSGARYVIAESAENVATVKEGCEEHPEPPRIWELDAGGLADIVGLGAGVADEEVTERRTALTGADIATLCYTSGTTGRPKGCALTHANIFAGAGNSIELMLPVFKEVAGTEASTLLFLPLAHILGRTLQIACLYARIEVGHCPSIKPDELRPELQAFQPTFVVGVPYLFEKIHDTGRATAEKIGRGASFERADRIAVDYGEAHLAQFLGTGKGPSLKLKLAHGLYDLLVYRRIRKELGGKLSYAISGGSPLDRRLSLFFYAAGIVIYEGYGLTETCGGVTLSPPLEPRIGTVGQPIPGSAIRIADDGEVLIKGGTVFQSYWNNPAASDAVLEDQWFSTGDLGALDDQGYLTITGRKKDIIVTSGGKNVSPAVLEDRLRSRPPVGQCIVVGDNRSFVSAVITLEADAVQHWLSVRKRPKDTPLAEVVRDAEMIADVQRAVDYANEAVSRAESIRKFTLVPAEFTEENGMLTPSLKIKRHAIVAAYADEIEALYGG